MLKEYILENIPTYIGGIIYLSIMIVGIVYLSNLEKASKEFYPIAMMFFIVLMYQLKFIIPNPKYIYEEV
jgi:hypothetical protein